MLRYVIVSVGGGLLFGILDGALNANPLAARLMEAYKPIARKSMNVAAGIVIDLSYGFILAGMFILLYASLPGAGGLVKGLSFAAGVWFLRVAMSAASSWMMFTVPLKTVGYSMAAGFLEMAVLGVLYGITLAHA